jgi:hypothetical protein
MKRDARLEPIPGDGEDRLRCSVCGSTLFENWEDKGDAAQLEVRTFEGSLQVREPHAGTVQARMWRPAPQGLMCTCNDADGVPRVYNTTTGGNYDPDLA